VHSVAARIVAAARPVAGIRRFSGLRLGLPVAVAVTVAAMASANGAYFPTSWGWPAIVFGWTALLALVIASRIELSALEWVTIGALGSLTAWTAASAAWSEDVTQTSLEVEHILVYLTALAAATLVLQRKGVHLFLGAVLAAIVAVSTYSLATRLFPERLATFDPVAVNRLEQPLGYWNSLGTFSAMGVLLALGFAARAPSVWGRAVAGASLPILLSTLYFTFGRGAWIALGAGIVAAVALDCRRLQLITTLLVLSPAGVIAVWLGSHSDALTSRRLRLVEASHAGHRLAPVVLALALASGALTVALAACERRLPRLPRARRVYGRALCALVAAGVVAVFVGYGTPWSIAHRGYESFTAPAPDRTAQEKDLNRRLSSFWGSGRAEFWHVAWRDAREHPLLGSGAGTYEQYWLRHRPIDSDVRDAHSVYLEMLAELGPLGLALVAIVLGVPLLAAVKAHRRPLVGAASGAYVVYLVHAGVDWDWEMTAVTVTALLCAAALLVSARTEQPPRSTGIGMRTLLVGVTLAAVAYSLVGLMANTAASESSKAASAGNWDRAEAKAREAIRWAPWSSHGWQALGEAQVQQLKLSQARHSFHEALSKDPGDWSVWLELAFASSGRQRREAVQRAAVLNPRSPDIERIRSGGPSRSTGG
jgi:O-antigen ligase